MTKEEKKRLSAVIRATKYLFLETIARKPALDYRAVPNSFGKTAGNHEFLRLQLSP